MRSRASSLGGFRHQFVLLSSLLRNVFGSNLSARQFGLNRLSLLSEINQITQRTRRDEVKRVLVRDSRKSSSVISSCTFVLLSSPLVHSHSQPSLHHSSERVANWSFYFRYRAALYFRHTIDLCSLFSHSPSSPPKWIKNSQYLPLRHPNIEI